MAVVCPTCDRHRGHVSREFAAATASPVLRPAHICRMSSLPSPRELARVAAGTACLYFVSSWLPCPYKLKVRANFEKNDVEKRIQN
jgi:hypothetical protein